MKMKMKKGFQNVMGSTGRGISRVLSPAHNLASNASLTSKFLTGGFAIGGIMAANKVINSTFGRRRMAVDPGTPIMSGKRGIDANHLNSSGVGLAMHKNRRRF